MDCADTMSIPLYGLVTNAHPIRNRDRQVRMAALRIRRYACSDRSDFWLSLCITLVGLFQKGSDETIL